MKLENNVNTDTLWEIFETTFIPEQIVTTGSNYMIGNGYLGYRGTFADDGRNEYVACVLSDTYDNADGVWKELVTVPNALFTTLTVDGKRLSWNGEDKDRYRRTLNFRYGLWSAEASWSDSGISAREERFASAGDIHLLMSRTTIHASRSSELTVTTGIDDEIWSLNGNHYREMTGLSGDGDAEMVGVTGEHGYEIVVQERAVLERSNGGEVKSSPEGMENGETRQLRRFVCVLAESETVILTKYVALYSTNDLRDKPNPHTAVFVPDTPATTGTLDPARSAAEARWVSDPVDDSEKPAREEVRGAARTVLDRAVSAGWDRLLSEHREVWDRRWERMDVRIGGDDLAQTVLRYNIYHNIIATPAHTDHLPVGARGLSCQAYQGAAFWDQEVFNLPMYLYTVPEIARNILVYRYKTLDGARRKARDLGYEGAFFAWISGDSGEEICPAYFFRDLVSGRRIRNHFNDWQIHISPDIVFTIHRYISVTGDYSYLRQYGAEIVFEVARFLVSRTVYRRDRDRYDVIRVLGPDEYHENVDNNFFTNFQVQFAATYAVDVFRWLQEKDPETLNRLSDRIGLAKDEPERWAEIAHKIYVPAPDPDTGLIEQFAGFFQLEDITPGELKGRLIDPGEYWGWPNGIAFETQVTKQADVNQLFMLHPDTYSREIMKANWEYYEPRTQHGSSLSPAVYATVAAWVGHIDQAYRYFLKSCTVDLYNDNKAISGGTFIGGIHTAACGVSWQIVVFGFAGLYRLEEGLGFRPNLPRHWKKLSFFLNYRSCAFTVNIERGEALSDSAEDGGPDWKNRVALTVVSDSGNLEAVALEAGDGRRVVEPGREVVWNISCPGGAG